MFKALSYLDNLTEHKASKFLMKNGGKLIGSAIHKATKVIGKPEWGEKVAKGIEKLSGVASQTLGKDHEITKSLKNASDESKGVSTEWRSINNEPSTALVPVTQAPPSGFYNKNLGGTNFKRYARRHKFKRVNAPKFAKKKPHKLKTLKL